IDPVITDTYRVSYAAFLYARRDWNGVLKLLAHVETFTVNEPTFGMYAYRASARLQLQDLDGALADANQALTRPGAEVPPSRAWVLGVRGQALIAKGSKAEGLADLEEAARLD